MDASSIHHDLRPEKKRKGKDGDKDQILHTIREFLANEIFTACLPKQALHLS